MALEHQVEVMQQARQVRRRGGQAEVVEPLPREQVLVHRAAAQHVRAVGVLSKHVVSKHAPAALLQTHRAGPEHVTAVGHNVATHARKIQVVTVHIVISCRVIMPVPAVLIER